MELTFGEQIKIILKRKNMTIRMLADLIEQQTGKPMSRQNLTQKLNRDNFQEQDMKEIAQALGCVVQISVIDPMEATIASLQSMMPPAVSVQENGTAVLPRVPAARRNLLQGNLSGRADEPENERPENHKEIQNPEIREASQKDRRQEEAEEDVDSGVLKEIEMALMQSVQKEMGASAEEEKAGPRSYDALSWARKRPSVWPRLIVPGEEEKERRTESGYVGDEPAFVETEDDLDGLEFIETEENGDGSAASEDSFRSYGSVRKSADEAKGGDISFASAPYVIPREPETERADQPAGWEENGMGYVELSPEDLYERPIDDAAETVQERESGVSPGEADVDEKMASWDAAVKRRLGRPILRSAEERRARKAAKEAEAEKEKKEEKGAGIPDIDPRTGKEYETNTVKHHPTKPDMLLVYDQDEHMWVEQAERAFTNFQIRKRAMLGRDYEPPIYLD